MIGPIESIPMMGSGVEPMPTTKPAGPAGMEPMPTTKPASPAGGAAFADMLSSSIGAVNEQMLGAERMSEMAATGELPDPTVALVEVEKADLAFQMAVQVRNKMVESWQEMTRMGF